MYICIQKYIHNRLYFHLELMAENIAMYSYSAFYKHIKKLLLTYICYRYINDLGNINYQVRITFIFNVHLNFARQHSFTVRSVK